MNSISTLDHHRTRACWTRFHLNFRIQLQFLPSTNSNKTQVRSNPSKTQVSFDGERKIWNKKKWERTTDPIQSTPAKPSSQFWSDPSKTQVQSDLSKTLGGSWVCLGLLISLFLFGCCVWLLEKKSFWKWVVFDCWRRRLFDCFSFLFGSVSPSLFSFLLRVLKSSLNSLISIWWKMSLMDSSLAF
mgnify:CR=1 FL=1